MRATEQYFPVVLFIMLRQFRFNTEHPNDCCQTVKLISGEGWHTSLLRTHFLGCHATFTPKRGETLGGTPNQRMAVEETIGTPTLQSSCSIAKSPSLKSHSLHSLGGNTTPSVSSELYSSKLPSDPKKSFPKKGNPGRLARTIIRKSG